MARKIAIFSMVVIIGFACLLVIGATIDKRGLTAEYPVWRKSITQMSWPGGGAAAEKTEDIVINGIIEQICIRISAVSEAITTTITIDDDLTNELYNSGAIADGAKYVYTMADFLPTANNIPAVGTITIGVNPTAEDADEAMTVDIDIYGR